MYKSIKYCNLFWYIHEGFCHILRLIYCTYFNIYQFIQIFFDNISKNRYSEEFLVFHTSVSHTTIVDSRYKNLDKLLMFNYIFDCIYIYLYLLDKSIILFLDQKFAIFCILQYMTLFLSHIFVNPCIEDIFLII